MRTPCPQALTIHKCQGLTLDLVQVSLKAMFAQGQAYVALSRARSLEGLQILDWDPGCVQTNSAVAAFYSALKVRVTTNSSFKSALGGLQCWLTGTAP